MKRVYFSGVAVHHEHVAPGKTTMVGVWLQRRILPHQREKLMLLNERFRPGHIGVRIGKRGTAVMYLGCSVSGTKAARKLAASLIQDVRAVVGSTAILRQLRNYSEVSRALAG